MRALTSLRALIIFFSLVSTTVSAEPLEIKSLLTPPVDDVSVEYLGTIFGNIAPNLMQVGIKGNSQILGYLFEIFNQVALIVAIVLITYTVIIGTINTAGSGKMLGEKWNGAWLPLRTAAGVALLVPMKTGYCVIQALVMWIVYFGIGGASTLWSTAIDYLSEGHQLYSAQGVSQAKIDGMTDAIPTSQAIFASQLCNVMHNNLSQDVPKQVYGMRSVKPQDSGSTWFHFGYTEADGGPGTECGSIELLSDKQLEPMQQFSRDVGYLVNAYWDRKNLGDYIEDLRLTLDNFHNQMQLVLDAPSPVDLSAYKKNGWLLAGNYYRQLSRTDAVNTAKVVYPKSGISYTESFPECEKFKECRGVITQAKETMSMMSKDAIALQFSKQGAGQAYGNLSGPRVTEWWYTLGVGWAFSHLTDPIIRAVGGNFYSVGDPFESAVRLGYTMMEAAAWIVTSTLLVGNAVFGMVANVCRAQNPAGPAAHTVQSVIATLVLGVAGFLYTQGAMLAIYLPLIPFIIFLVGALGWFISVIESMVAAPLLAIGLMWPDAQHEVLGRAEPALMLLLNLFLRPSLMILGLIAGILVCWVGFKLTNLGFMTMISTETISFEATFGWFILGFIYAMLLISIAKKCFSLIHVVPDKVLTWIGDHSQHSGGADEFIGAVQSGSEKGAGATGGIASGAGQYVGYDGRDLVSSNVLLGVNKVRDARNKRQLEVE